MGHAYTWRSSCLSLVVALMCMTGISWKSCLLVELASELMTISHLAPSKNKPSIYAPSRGASLCVRIDEIRDESTNARQKMCRLAAPFSKPDKNDCAVAHTQPLVAYAAPT